MDTSEELVAKYLSHRGHSRVVYEPDGNVPPDFVVDDRIAVEVRRLNQSFGTGASLRGLEETDIPLWKKVNGLAASFGSPTKGMSWFVTYSFSRPLSWKKLEPALKEAFRSISDGTANGRTIWKLGKNFELEVLPASKLHETLFVPGGYSDHDSGGWVLSEIERNLKIYIDEKTNKFSAFKHKYSSWWLILVDYITFGLDESERGFLKSQIKVADPWDKIIVLDPRDATRAFEL